MEYQLLRTLYNLSILACMRECQARPSCGSIDYFQRSKRCEMNTVELMATGTLSVQQGAGHIAKSDWIDFQQIPKQQLTSPWLPFLKELKEANLYFQNEFDQCSCSVGQKCIISSGSHTCVIDECPILQTQTLANMNAVGSKSEHNVNCLKDTQDFTDFGAGNNPDVVSATLTCSPDGAWKVKMPAGGQCLAVAFIMAPGTQRDPYTEYLEGEDTPTELTWNQYYRGSIIDHWHIFPINTIRLSIFKTRQEVKYVIFNGIGSNYLTWFSQSRVMESSWIDLSSNIYDYFSMYGQVDLFVKRRFFYEPFS